MHPFREVLWSYAFFLVVDVLTATLAFLLEKERENWTLIFQRFFYRQLMYYVAIKTILMALKGKVVGWKKFERKATVAAPM